MLMAKQNPWWVLAGLTKLTPQPEYQTMIKSLAAFPHFELDWLYNFPSIRSICFATQFQLCFEIILVGVTAGSSSASMLGGFRDPFSRRQRM